MALIDVPYSMGAPSDFNGIYLNGWQCHDDFGRHVYPASLWRELVGRFGKPSLEPEVFGPQTVGTLSRLRAEMLASLGQTAAVCEYLLERERFDLFAVVLGGVHRGGHYLWDLSQIDARDLPASERAALAEGNHDLYRAADDAVGRILAKAPAGARVMVFALHGMGPNTGWTERFPHLVGQIHRGGPAGGVKTGLLYRVKKALPWELVREVTTRLPTEVNKRLISLWSARMLTGRPTRFFALPVDCNGFVRVNLRGREAQGIVAPGNEYADVVGEIVDGFTELRGHRDRRADRRSALADRGAGRRRRAAARCAAGRHGELGRAPADRQHRRAFAALRRTALGARRPLPLRPLRQPSAVGLAGCRRPGHRGGPGGR